jgi:hypothetical protein
VIVACAGLWYEINATGYAATPGSTVKTFANVVKRSDFPVQLDHIKVLNTAKDTTVRLELKPNELLNLPVTVALPAALEVTQPYWLVNAPSKGMYRVDDLQLIGKPEKEPQLTAEFRFRIGGVPFVLRSPCSTSG